MLRANYQAFGKGHVPALVTDGPFADTKEAFGGYYLFEADDVQDVIRIAARIPAARIGGSVEVRRIVHR